MPSSCRRLLARDIRSDLGIAPYALTGSFSRVGHDALIVPLTKGRKIRMADYPTRKKLRLESYDYSEEGFYYLTVCTKDRRNILSDIRIQDDHTVAVQLTPYGEAAERYLKSLPGINRYVIMPNHIHMIIHKTNGKSIASDVRSWKGLVSKTIGAKIWQDSYYDHIIRNEKDYLEKCRYIDENPARWAKDEYYA